MEAHTRILPLEISFPEAGCAPEGLGDTAQCSDSPHHAVVGARAYRDPLLQDLTLTQHWEVSEVLDVSRKVL